MKTYKIFAALMIGAVLCASPVWAQGRGGGGSRGGSGGGHSSSVSHSSSPSRSSYSAPSHSSSPSRSSYSAPSRSSSPSTPSRSSAPSRSSYSTPSHSSSPSRSSYSAPSHSNISRPSSTAPSHNSSSISRPSSTTPSRATSSDRSYSRPTPATRDNGTAVRGSQNGVRTGQVSQPGARNNNEIRRDGGQQPNVRGGGNPGGQPNGYRGGESRGQDMHYARPGVPGGHMPPSHRPIHPAPYFHHPIHHGMIHMHPIFWEPLPPRPIYWPGFWFYCNNYWYDYHVTNVVVVHDYVQSTYNVNMISYAISGDLMYALVEEPNGDVFIQVFDQNDRILAEQKVNHRYCKMEIDRENGGCWILKRNDKDPMLFIYSEGQFLIYEAD